MRLSTLGIIGVLWCGLLLPAAAKPAPISLKIRPGPVASAPVTLRIEVRYRPIESDRYIMVALNGDQAYSESQTPIDPTWEPHLVTLTWRIRTAGEYTIIAAIGSDDQHVRAFVRQPLILL